VTAGDRCEAACARSRAAAFGPVRTATCACSRDKTRRRPRARGRLRPRVTRRRAAAASGNGRGGCGRRRWSRGADDSGLGLRRGGLGSAAPARGRERGDLGKGRPLAWAALAQGGEVPAATGDAGQGRGRRLWRAPRPAAALASPPGGGGALCGLRRRAVRAARTWVRVRCVRACAG
jgi:hypothetical protein